MGVSKNLIQAGKGVYRALRQFPIERDLLRRKEFVAEQIRDLNGHMLRQRISSYVGSMRSDASKIGDYVFSASQSVPVLYNATYAVMTLHLLNELQSFSSEERSAWLDYFSRFQEEDGLFKDPKLENRLAKTEDWWGWRHLALQVIISVTALGGVVEKPFEFLNLYYDLDFLISWLENQDWDNKSADVSNAVQNIGALMQYSRDFHANDRARAAVDCMLDWLEKTQDAATGFWGEAGQTPESLSLGVQTGYHLWLLFFYDKRPLHHIDRIIDSSLATQNKFGGYGVKSNSSACEDIDSMDPLVRLTLHTEYRRDEIHESLKEALPWIIVNMNEDGGFVFRRSERLYYGHDLMSANSNQSSLFPTWFRTLNLAYLAQVMPDTFLNEIDWQFTDCPGLQFFRQTGD